MTGDVRLRETDLGVDDFVALPDEEGYRLELSEGRLVREPAPGPRHGDLEVRIGSRLRAVAVEAGLGIVFTNTAFTLSRKPATVRAPDVSFVSAGRMPEEEPGDRFWELAPDLAVEIVSPSNTASGIQAKALEYLDAGSRRVWTVDPAGRAVTVYRSRSDIRILEGDDVLEADDVLPGLSLPVESLFR